MTILCDKSIAELANNHKMIEPFVSKQVRADDKGDKIISYGNSSYGYDARVSNEFKIFTNIDSAIVDPKNFSETSKKYFGTEKATEFLLDFILTKYELFD